VLRRGNTTNQKNHQKPTSSCLVGGSHKKRKDLRKSPLLFLPRRGRCRFTLSDRQVSVSYGCEIFDRETLSLSRVRRLLGQ